MHTPPTAQGRKAGASSCPTVESCAQASLPQGWIHPTRRHFPCQHGAKGDNLSTTPQGRPYFSPSFSSLKGSVLGQGLPQGCSHNHLSCPLKGEPAAQKYRVQTSPPTPCSRPGSYLCAPPPPAGFLTPQHPEKRHGVSGGSLPCSHLPPLPARNTHPRSRPLCPCTHWREVGPFPKHTQAPTPKSNTGCRSPPQPLQQPPIYLVKCPNNSLPTRPSPPPPGSYSHHLCCHR